MENPASWTRAEWVVQKALDQAERAKAEGAIYGLSLARLITDALRSDGLLPDLPALGMFKSPYEPEPKPKRKLGVVTRADAEAMQEAHAEGWHIDAPREFCPECEDRPLSSYPRDPE